MQVKDGSSTCVDAELPMIIAILIAANMCLQGGKQVDVSRYVVRTASSVELKVTLNLATGVLVIYSPGFEEQQVRFTQAETFGSVSFAEPVLCIKAIGGPFEFNIEIISTDDPAGLGSRQVVQPAITDAH